MPNNLVYLAGRVFNTPLFITPDKLQIIMGVLMPKLTGGSLPETVQGEPPASSLQVSTPPALGNGQHIAVIPVHGTLVHRASGLDAWSGLLSYGEIRRMHMAALRDPDAGAILFHLDTNGGESAGLMDLVDEIHQARNRKPSYAFVDEKAFSAGYAIASAVGKIFMPRTAGAGSVGVIAQHMDQSAMNEQRGIKYTPVFAGARKNDFSPHAPLSDEAQDVLRGLVDRSYELFVETVARNRNMSADAVRKTEAGLFWGRDAVAVGFADAIKTWDEAIEAIAEDVTKRPKGGTRMSRETLQKQLQALFKGDDQATVAAALDGLGYQPKQAAADLEQATGKAREEGRAAALAQVGEIADLCALAGTPLLLGPLLKEGKTVEEARSEILKHKAEAADNARLQSTVGAGAGTGVNHLLADAKKRAGIDQ